MHKNWEIKINYNKQIGFIFSLKEYTNLLNDLDRLPKQTTYTKAEG